MSEGSGRPRSLDELPRFDPGPSIRLALDLLAKAGVPHALAGRVAVWAWVPPQDQELTKDVDFAVPRGDIDRLEAAARAAGYRVRPLPIGGFAIRSGDARIDFIDRRVDLERLFADAVEAAGRDDDTLRESGGATVRVVPLPHLVAMKIATGEPRDENDVRRLLRVPGVDYDRVRALVREHAGVAGANRLDRLAVAEGIAAAHRYLLRESPSE